MSYAKFLISVLLLLIGGTSIVYAEDKDPVEIPLVDDPYNTNRPRMPAKTICSIECYYLDGWIHLAFEEPEGNAVLVVTDMADGASVRQQFNTAVPTKLFIGKLDTVYKIEIVTAEGNHYIGWLNNWI